MLPINPLSDHSIGKGVSFLLRGIITRLATVAGALKCHGNRFTSFFFSCEDASYSILVKNICCLLSLMSCI